MALNWKNPSEAPHFRSYPDIGCQCAGCRRVIPYVPEEKIAQDTLGVNTTVGVGGKGVDVRVGGKGVDVRVGGTTVGVKVWVGSGVGVVVGVGVAAGAHAVIAAATSRHTIVVKT